MDSAVVRNSAQDRRARTVLGWSEKEFQEQVVTLAQALRWRYYHTHRSDRSPAGFPDLVLVHPARGRLLFRELKSEKGSASAAQREWIEDLSAAHQDVGVWRPRDWLSGEIHKQLGAPSVGRV